MHSASPLFSRALLALTAAATIAVTPLAAVALGPADSGQSAHSIPAYLISRISHDVGHNDWAFQGQNAGRIGWVVTYVGLALFWLAVSIWIRIRTRRAGAAVAGVVANAVDGVDGGADAGAVANAVGGGSAADAEAAAVDGTAAGTAAGVEASASTATATAPAPAAVGEGRGRLWLRVLLAAWAAELLAGLLTFGGVAYAEWTSTPIGAEVLRAADLCSPWWSCVAAVLVVARAERSAIAVRAIAGYAALLAIVLLVPLPGPDAVKVLLLALPAAVPAMLTSRQAEPTEADLTRSAVAAG
jgi:hypothetical protein